MNTATETRRTYTEIMDIARANGILAKDEALRTGRAWKAEGITFPQAQDRLTGYSLTTSENLMRGWWAGR